MEAEPAVAGALKAAPRSWRQFAGVAAAVVLAELGWLATLSLAPTPLRAIVAAVGLVGASAVLLSPQIGMGLLAALMIGQWPYGIVRYVGLLTLPSAGTWLMLRRKPLFPANPILLLGCAYLLIVLGSALQPATRVELWPAVLTSIFHVSLIWLWVAHWESRRFLLLIVRLMVISGIITAVIGIIQWRTHFVWIASTTARAIAFNTTADPATLAFELQQWNGQFRADSITGTPDFLALYMQTLLPFAGIWMVRQVRWSRRLLGLGIVLLLGVAHLLSFTRGAILTTAIVLFLMGWLLDRHRLLIYGPVLLLVGVMAILSWAPWRDRLISIITLQAEGADAGINTGEWRLRTIPVGLEMMLERPFFGVGVGQQQWNWPEHTIGVLIFDPKHVEPLPIHNTYLLVGIELGFGGLFALLMLIGVALHRLLWLRARFLRRHDQELADLCLAILLGLVGIAAAMTMYPLIAEFRYFWLLLALTGALLQLEAAGGASSPAPLPARGGDLAGGAAAG